MERFQPAAVLDRMEHYAVTTFIAAPTAIIALLAEETLDVRDLSSFRVVQTGGSSTPMSVLREANQRLGCPVVDLYGMLESGATSCTSETTTYEDIGTVGRPYPWLQARILDADDVDVDVPVGTEGEIAKTGPTIMVGY